MRISILLFGLVGTLAAQEPPTTRAAEIESVRAAKQKTLRPELVSKPENFLSRLKDEKILERFGAGYRGFRPKIGNMVTGGGFAAGLEYYREDLFEGDLSVRASAQVSTRGYQKFEAEAILPRFVNNRLFLDLIAGHRNYGGLNYYGPGPLSRKTGRSNYRLEDTSFDGILGMEMLRHVKVGTGLGGLFVNVGPGNQSRFISAEKQFSPAISPGIDRQTDFLRYSAFTQIDFRDNPLGPKSGGNYVFQISWYKDHKLDLYNFRRMDIDLEQHIPFLNKTRRLVLRAKGVFSDTEGPNQVPFYLSPIVGGSDDLRGYRYFRFSDRNSIVYNAEYRWEIFSGLDGALFFDAGKVMPRKGQLAFSNLESDAGFGLRFNTRNTTTVRIDVGFSQEGFQVWFKFNDFLNTRRFGTNTLQPAY